MRERLDAIDWASLSHAYGPATDIPELLLMLQGDPRERGKVLWRLSGNLYHQGTRHPATPAAIPFLLEIAQRLSAREQSKVWGLISCCVAGDLGVTRALDSADGSLWGGPQIKTNPRATDTSAEVLRQIETAAAEGIQAAMQALRAESAALRQAVACFLSCFHQREAQHQISASLWDAYQTESHAPTRAVLAFALIHTTPRADEERLSLLLEDAHELVRAVAAMMLTQRMKDEAPELARSLLEESKHASQGSIQDYQALSICGSDLTEDVAATLAKISP